MNRCLQVAKNGLGTTRPNPMVGAVVVYNDKIIGEGFTCPYGGNHAEVNAINTVKDQSLLTKSTLYVTLEPCSHFGKTPPCSDLIIKHKIPTVVIGCVDDNPEVAGKGIAKLEASGCKVILGVLEAKCKEHHKRFFTFHNKKRPYIILKWAETKDGFIAPLKRDAQKPIWITNPYSRQLVHKWRSEEQAILVGTKTVLEDNPSLTVRDWTGENPVRIVLDRTSKLKSHFNIFNTEAKTLIISENEIDFSKPIAPQICAFLYENNINSVLIEGGALTLKTFIDEGLWDEARVYAGEKEFKSGTRAPQLEGKLISESKIKTDVLRIYAKN
jgi:diaminohydroxyphosphoribosylaminopyrimidine deaminase/5-amino-6-(5-phosphoribosylamino)uracil reductase